MGQDYVSEFAQTAEMAAQLDSGPPFLRMRIITKQQHTVSNKATCTSGKRRRSVTTSGSTNTHTHTSSY